MADLWFRAKNHINFHDPLAAASIFEPTIITTIAGKVKVDCSEISASGVTSIAIDLRGNHFVSVSVDPVRFFDHDFNLVVN